MNKRKFYRNMRRQFDDQPPSNEANLIVALIFLATVAYVIYTIVNG